ncbi:hypothetical protein [uncultured Microbulbifer sp.]|uniref:hypothetical protein n=1 Tax=uncultured Microbulbifer sp. TaxID=348147 RepID=UPI0025D8AA70|nr:hypothetical protein [uncultured Microbulbifer sp.]
MRTFKIGSLALAGLLSTASLPSVAQSGFWGNDEATPSLAIAPAELKIDVPMPVSSGNLQLMLAQAANGGSLADLKQEAVRKYTQHLHSELARELHEFLDDEEVPLVQQDGVLRLRNNLDLKVIKHLSAMKPKDNYDLEQGNVSLTGEFRFVLSNQSGTALREQRISIDELKINRKYRVKTPRDGSASEDNTEEAINQALTDMVEELVKEMEDYLEADSLREIASI